MSGNDSQSDVDTGFEAVLAGETWAPPDIDADTASRQSGLAVSASEEKVNPPLTATVNPGLTPEGKQAAKALVQLPALTVPELSKLAREMAMDIKERHVILKEFGLTETQHDYLEANNEFYKAALHAACAEWHAPLSTPERIKIEAAAILEDSLPGLGARMQNKSEGLPGVVEAAKLFAKVAGVGEREAGGAVSGERFVISIDLGGDQKITLSAETASAADARPDMLSALLPNDEG
jgi:hypothetical protein